MKKLCIDLGGSRAKIEVMECGKSVSTDIFPIDSSCSMAETLSLLKNRIAKLDGFSGCDAVGFAYPGIVDRNNCRVVTAIGKYTDALSTDFMRWSTESFGLPITLINDAAAAICGEMAYGVGKGYGDSVLMMIGTGIGVAVFSEGKLLEGKHFAAGIMGGHIAINTVNPRLCKCGNSGCLEAYAGTWAIDELAREDRAFSESSLSRLTRIDYRAIDEGRRSGDELSSRLFNSACLALGTGAVNLIHAYDPEILILSGGASHIVEMRERIQEYIKTYSCTPWGTVKVISSEDPDISVLLGLNAITDRI